MDKNKIVTINGQRYDAQTGMPVNSKPTLAITKKPTTAAVIHGTPQKSQTLIRRITKKPAVSSISRPSRTPGHTMDIARSSQISKFARHPVTQSPLKPQTPDIPATMPQRVNRAHKLQAAKQKPTTTRPPKLAKDIKQEAIEAALAKPVAKLARTGVLARHPRLISVFSVSLAVILLGGYLTYVNMPNLSVLVADAQSGINASYPEYRPDGYRIDGPVTYSNDQVTINFVANTGTSKFSLQQAKSSWDSSAVLDNIVRKDVGENYITNQERGLTIYTYNGNAAWVNAGILYTINGTAPLSSDQIRRIATSL